MIITYEIAGSGDTAEQLTLLPLSATILLAKVATNTPIKSIATVCFAQLTLFVSLMIVSGLDYLFEENARR
jgi:hypothetical protein